MVVSVFAGKPVGPVTIGSGMSVFEPHNAVEMWVPVPVFLRAHDDPLDGLEGLDSTNDFVSVSVALWPSEEPLA